ncbi:hypothetical protein [Gloeothece verrucosa]|uniref:Uncharacterized protein n=1 Tax=Gloeothece verrucosa (strain PCC 7822) TaxID=497965 RepID=E0UHQ0_GLOV7|nr:hypothetical protein [Gloeothece verrucosa]ADN13307.1 conserved hypothetical protein [Gloeothece verrucosa PCC 7822]
MTNLNNNSIKPQVNRTASDTPWWNRRVFGNFSFLDYLIAKFSKQVVPESVLALHQGNFMDLRVFAKTALAVDNDRFTNYEFLLYVKIKYALRVGLDEYAGLKDSIELFQVAIEAKNSYITIDQIEIRYRSSKQQELYDYVQTRLTSDEDKTQFRPRVQEKLAELLPQIKTEEGRNAMQAYVEELDRLAEHELGLKLLCLFKAYQLADYSILRIISDLVSTLKEEDVTNHKTLVSLVLNKYEVFEKLGKIIGLTDQQNNPNTYARMVQYITLGYRHKLSYVKFEELMNVMRLWYKPYQVIEALRQQYTPKEYKLPKAFSEPLPGIEIYEKYKKSLTDKNTGFTYIDFNEN